MPKGGDWDEGMVDMLVALGILKLDAVKAEDEYEMAIKGKDLLDTIAKSS